MCVFFVYHRETNEIATYIERKLCTTWFVTCIIAVMGQKHAICTSWCALALVFVPKSNTGVVIKYIIGLNLIVKCVGINIVDC